MSKIILSEELKQLIINAYVTEGLTVTEICRLGLFPGNRKTLTKRLKEWNIPIKNRETRLQDNLDTIIELWKSGISLCKLLELFHINKKTISNKLKELGYEVINPQLQLLFNEHIFDSIDTEEKAYWLGFIYADGNIRTVNDFNRKTEYGFTLTLKKSDDNHLLKFNLFMEYNGDNRHYYNSKYHSCSWHITNEHLWSILNSYGCTPLKSLILKFPNKNVFKDESLIRHFIRGYFDGDGCFSLDKLKSGIIPRLSLLGTEDFVNKLNEFCKCNGTITKRHNKHIYYLLRFNRSNSINFMNYIYDNCSIYLDRKYAKYNLFKQYPLLPYNIYQDNIDIFENYI